MAHKIAGSKWKTRGGVVPYRADGFCIFYPGWENGRFCHGKPRYPTIRFDGKQQLASRLILSWKIGRPLRQGELACHSCDTPACVNPDHLFLGDKQVNHADMVAKGRQRKVSGPAWHEYHTDHARGSRNGNTTLTEADVLRIRERCAAGESQRIVGIDYGLTQANVSYIALGRTWAHVGGPLRGA